MTDLLIVFISIDTTALYVHGDGGRLFRRLWHRGCLCDNLWCYR